MPQLNKSQFLQFVLTSVAAAGELNPAEVEKQVDQLLTLVPHLAGDRKVILDATLANIITSIGRAETLVDDSENVAWLTPETGKNWIHWRWLEAYLRTEIRRPAQVMKELDKSTNEVIDQLGYPLRPGIWDRRGLVVGHVQSTTLVLSRSLDTRATILWVFRVGHRCRCRLKSTMPTIGYPRGITRRTLFLPTFHPVFARRFVAFCSP